MIIKYIFRCYSSVIIVLIKYTKFKNATALIVARNDKFYICLINNAREWIFD